MAWLVDTPDNIGNFIEHVKYEVKRSITLPDGDSCDPVITASIFDKYVEVDNTYYKYWCSKEEWDSSKFVAVK